MAKESLQLAESPQSLFDKDVQRETVVRELKITKPAVRNACSNELKECVDLEVKVEKLQFLADYLKAKRELEASAASFHGDLVGISKLGTSEGREEKNIPHILAECGDVLGDMHTNGTIYLTDRNPLELLDEDTVKDIKAAIEAIKTEQLGNIPEREEDLKERQRKLARELSELAKKFEESNNDVVTEIAKLVGKARKAANKKATDKAIEEAEETVKSGKAGTMTARSTKDSTIFDPLSRIIKELHTLENFDLDTETGESKKKIDIAKSLRESDVEIRLSSDINKILGYILVRQMEKTNADIAAHGETPKRLMSEAREIALERQYNEELIDKYKDVLRILEERPILAQAKAIVEGRGLLEEWRTEKGDNDELGEALGGNEQKWQEAIETDLESVQATLETAKGKLEKRLKSVRRWKKKAGDIRVWVLATLGLAATWGVGHFVTAPENTGSNQDDLPTLAAQLGITLDGVGPDGETIGDATEEFRAEIAGQLSDAKEQGKQEAVQADPEESGLSLSELNELLDSVIAAAIESGPYNNRDQVMTGIEVDLETEQGVTAAIIAIIEKTGTTASKYNPQALTNPRAIELWDKYRQLKGGDKTRADRALGM